MSTRPIHNRRVFRLESLEVRSAPSHFGVVGHAALALHQVHAAASVSHLNVPRSTEKGQTPEVKSGTDKGIDPKGSDTTSKDTTSIDKTSIDKTSIDKTNIDTRSTDPQTDG